ncbi:hypothetical protein YC2023_114419 [Brassica napus]
MGEFSCQEVLISLKLLYQQNYFLIRCGTCGSRAGLGGKREKRLIPAVIKLSRLAATFSQYLSIAPVVMVKFELCEGEGSRLYAVTFF